MTLLPEQLLSGPMIIMAKDPVSLFMAAWKRDASHQQRLNQTLPLTTGDISDVGDEDYVVLGMGAKRETLGLPNEYDKLAGYELINVMRSTVQTWHPNIRKLVELLDPESIGANRIRTSQPVAPWPTGRVTLLGDAIHSMTPYRGIGANIALRDAALLREKLGAVKRGESELTGAISRYEAQMREYAFAAVKQSRETMDRAISDRGPGFGLMKGVMRTINSIPPVKQRIMARMGE